MTTAIAADSLRPPLMTRKLFAGLAALIVLALASLVFVSEEQIGANKPFIEDAYFPLSVSRNIALGEGVTIDGERLTNGFQPLFTVLSSVSFMLADGDRILGLRLQMLWHAAIFVASALLAARLALRLAGAPHDWGTLAFPLLIYVGAIFPITIHFNGLETGLQLLLYLLCLRYYITTGAAGHGGALRFGGLLGVLVLTRIDAVFFVIIFTAVEMWRARQEPVAATVRGAAIGGTAFLVSLPWWAYNVFAFGSLMPSSGAALQEWGWVPVRWMQAFEAALQIAMPWLYTTWVVHLPLSAEIAAAAAGGLALAAIGFLLSAGAAQRAGIATSTDEGRRFLRFGRILFAHFFVLLVWYSLSSWAAFFYSRYLAFLFLLPVLFGGVAACRLGLPDKHRLASWLLAAFLAVNGLGVAAIYHTGALIDGNRLYKLVELVRETVPDDEVVGTGQSGTLGFFRDRVVNLDGRVNAEALEHQGRIAAYMRANGIDYVADTRGYLQSYIGLGPEERGWCLVGERDEFRVYRYSGPGSCETGAMRTGSPSR